MEMIEQVRSVIFLRYRDIGLPRYSVSHTQDHVNSLECIEA